MLRQAKRKHRTPVVKTIRVSIGSYSKSFRLETERLVGRKDALAQMAELHNQAKSLISRNPVTHSASPADLFSHYDIEPCPSIDWATTSDASRFLFQRDRESASLDMFGFMPHVNENHPDQISADDGFQLLASLDGDHTRASPTERMAQYHSD
jgi:hypothetical protein